MFENDKEWNKACRKKQQIEFKDLRNNFSILKKC